MERQIYRSIKEFEFENREAVRVADKYANRNNTSREYGFIYKVLYLVDNEIFVLSAINSGEYRIFKPKIDIIPDYIIDRSPNKTTNLMWYMK